MWDFAILGELTSGPARAEILDEALGLVGEFWLGEDVHHHGAHFTVDGARMVPPPTQRPRIPIWVAGYWPGRRPFQRAARWDGVVPLRSGELFQGLRPDELSECLAYIRLHRTAEGPFDAIYFHSESLPGWSETTALAAKYEHAGATWWLESTNPINESAAEFRRRVRAGPPG
jgi:alkanesulfonate monooxygenase SsuD/methylene tetrahydromethanopterin reductase-like flavin-dependent oxidoreductase (luciferase family)